MFVRKRRQIEVPKTAPNECIFAVGDVHGRYDLLVLLIERIFEDLKIDRFEGAVVRLIFLGDIIDRGPNSLECLEAVYKLTTYGAEILLGNHEDLLLRTLEGDAFSQSIWLEHGGLDALKSFGVTPPSLDEDSFDFAERFRESVPDHLLVMLKAAKTSTVSGDYFFVHAGVRPGTSLGKQKHEDLIGIRGEFTSSKRWHGAVVVHGHSIVDDVSIKNNRIAVDTGAYRSGKLSCAVLCGTHKETISVQNFGDTPQTDGFRDSGFFPSFNGATPPERR